MGVRWVCARICTVEVLGSIYSPLRLYADVGPKGWAAVRMKWLSSARMRAFRKSGEAGAAIDPLIFHTASIPCALLFGIVSHTRRYGRDLASLQQRVESAAASRRKPSRSTLNSIGRSDVAELPRTLQKSQTTSVSPRRRVTRSHREAPSTVSGDPTLLGCCRAPLRGLDGAGRSRGSWLARLVPPALAATPPAWLVYRLPPTSTTLTTPCGGGGGGGAGGWIG